MAQDQNQNNSQALAQDCAVSPMHFEHSSRDEHVSVNISGSLNLEELNLSLIDLFDYQVYLYVHPLNTEKWWRQNPSQAAKCWTAQAYLGGIGQYTAKDGEVFQIIAIISTNEPPDVVNRLNLLKRIEKLQFVSEILTVTVRTLNE